MRLGVSRAFETGTSSTATSAMPRRRPIWTARPIIAWVSAPSDVPRPLPTARMRSRTPLARRARDAGRFGHRPHAFEVVIGAYFGTEDVHDHVAGVDQHPVALARDRAH